MTRYGLTLAAALLASLGSSISFAQEDRGTPEQRIACTPDAFRLCSSEIPDPAGVEACLRFKKADLSDGCRLVFDRATTAPARNK